MADHVQEEMNVLLVSEPSSGVVMAAGNPGFINGDEEEEEVDVVARHLVEGPVTSISNETIASSETDVMDLEGLPSVTQPSSSNASRCHSLASIDCDTGRRMSTSKSEQGSKSDYVIPVLTADEEKKALQGEVDDDVASSVSRLSECEAAAADVERGGESGDDLPVNVPVVEVTDCSGANYDSDVPFVEEEDGLFSISRIVRASMRRMRHFRMSSRRATVPNDDDTTFSENASGPSQHQQSSETHSAPLSPSDRAISNDTDIPSSNSTAPLGLPTVTSPVTSGIIVTSLMSVINSPPPRTPETNPRILTAMDHVTVVPTRTSRPLIMPTTVMSEFRDNNRSSGEENQQNETNVRERSERDDEDDTNRPRRRLSLAANSLTELRSPSGHWPHNFSAVLALLGCTVGLFNLSRFAVLSVQFGANFIVQFLILSLLFGIPLFTFHLSLGQYLGSGVIDMWKISPIFQGVGIAIMLSQAFIGIYSVVGISWMFVYFRDAFITHFDQYKWGNCFAEYRTECRLPKNYSGKLEENIPDYFSGVVLQRDNSSFTSTSFGNIKFQVAFNLGIVWMIVFVTLSKGLKSYGKVIYAFVLLPIFGLLTLCSMFFGIAPWPSGYQLFGNTVWKDFFFNSNTWMAAAREVFFTWGLFGASAMQITAQNKARHNLRRDSGFVITVTLTLLLLVAFFANTCVQIIQSNGYDYVPGSYDNQRSYVFLKVADPHDRPEDMVLSKAHTNLAMGVRVKLEDGVSGYQAVRLATEIFPAAVTFLKPTYMSPFWTILFYLVFILFGLTQQLAIWHCVVSGIISIKAKSLKSWETTIAFFVCAVAFILGLPLTTERGMSVVYLLDTAIGGAWWIMIAYLLQLVAVFVVRGSPYNGENIVTVLLNGPGRFVAVTAPLLSFTWNVILPVALLVLSITSFKNGHFRELFDWNAPYAYWSPWVRQLGCAFQLVPLLLVPFVAFVQSCRYLASGPPDLFDRIALLYRPSESSLRRQRTQQNLTSIISTNLSNGTNSRNDDATTARSLSSFTEIREDPPPKYTPPPSYSTATGARIAKMLRQSFRRSMRRLQSLTGDNSTSGSRAELSEIPSISSTCQQLTSLPPPPDYTTVLLEMSRSSANIASVTANVDVASDEADASSGTSPQNNALLAVTPAEVAQLLRCSLRRNRTRGGSCRVRRSHAAERQREERRSADNAAVLQLDANLSSSVI